MGQKQDDIEATYLQQQYKFVHQEMNTYLIFVELL